MAKVIMVKVKGPRLIPAAAMEYDEKTKSVILSSPVQLEDGADPVHYVKAELCFELDNETMTTVNTLSVSSETQKRAAELLCEHELKPAYFQLGDEDTPVTH